MMNFIEKNKQNELKKQLTLDWITAKRAETEFKEKRLAVEKELLKILDIKEDNKGTFLIDNGVKVQCAITRKWSSEFLNKYLVMLKSIDKDKRPFKINYVFEEIKDKMEALRVYHPEKFSVLKGGLTEVVSKPSFSAVTNKKIGE